MNEITKWNNELKKTGKLFIELVPKTCWFSNVRSEVSKNEWDKIRKEVYINANYKCEICNGTGDRWPVECHEIWDYNDVLKKQTLTGFISLCPNCHKTKHRGFSSSIGIGDIVDRHLSKINDWDINLTIKYVKLCFEQWRERSKHEWKLDISYLKKFYVHSIITTEVKK